MVQEALTGQVDPELEADQADVELIPQELRDRFPEVVEDLRAGLIDEIPDRVIEQLPPSVVDRIPQSLLESDVNTTLVIVLVAIAGLALAGFAWGVLRAGVKAALFFLLVGSVAALFLYWQF